ncbi:MAG: phasin family protein [Pseudomonadota bacterium]
MREQIENVLSKVADSARTGMNGAVDATQERVTQASKAVANTKKPVQRVSKASLEVNAVAFRTSKELIELQSKSVQKGIDAIAKRLREAARADSARELLAQQRDVLPGAARYYADNAKTAFSIVRGAVNELGATINILRDQPVAKKAKSAARKTTKTAKTAKAKARTVAKKVAKTVSETQSAAQSA